MNDQDKCDSGKLVPTGSRDLAPLASENPLITRGLGDLASIAKRDLQAPERSPYAPGRLALRCARCDWKDDDQRFDSERCPKCNGPIDPNCSLRFGGLLIEARSKRNTFLLVTPHTQCSVEIEAADIMDTIRFLTGRIRDIHASVSFHCAGCEWSVEGSGCHLAVECCLKCGGHLAGDKILRFGDGLTIECSPGFGFYLHPPRAEWHAHVQIDEADLAGTIRFMTRHFRPD